MMIVDPLDTTAQNWVIWRLDRKRHAASWDSGEGAFQSGGRWNSKGVRAVYCSLDAATTILEVAVHKSFQVLDVDPHTLTVATIPKTQSVYRVDPATIPNSNWLLAAPPSAGQQAYGDALLANNDFVLIPSVISSNSWNVIFDPVRCAGKYQLLNQQLFALDTRLNPPKS